MQTKSTHCPVSNLRATQDYAPRPRKELMGLSSLFDALSLANLAFYAHTAHAAVRNFHGRIGILFATRGGVPLGPALQQLQAGHLQRNARTYARAEGIRNLQATHPWVDKFDLQIFLAGFDAGEQHCITEVANSRNNSDTLQSQTS